jgi:hypothetical protein
MQSAWAGLNSSAACRLDLPYFYTFPYTERGPGSSVGIATGYGLDDPGMESRWGGEIFLTSPDRPWGPTQPPVQWVRGLSRGKKRPGRDADFYPLLVPWSWKGRAIPLLLLWVVRLVQSLSACTRLHFTVRTVESLSACTRVHFTVRPVQSLSACTRVHFTVRPVQSLSACTRVQFTYTWNDFRKKTYLT